ncbi:hypothetical protein AAA799B03_00974 [Marine Group I thaumarchaeote SCGC AAA799-B03]|uniref:Uncharacterized protein n=3 Tax=Marine Group I TaxID=905826 RepID=A0A087S6X1_9ARCH|nr:hypothetical protein AAA799N04_00831 [Marine Group I thaumarchaeote SCGC AAA799-N04]KFM19205.1 hypothetical protein SCCGRSA3_00790 [Marine Group I thaumarchaeote SCGC RSA3]KFM21475.1 hypothetical protein AAA799B03_00974 [Marine Group I thaumarchaeote SCGC AAA799-B03]
MSKKFSICDPSRTYHQFIEDRISTNEPIIEAHRLDRNPRRRVYEVSADLAHCDYGITKAGVLSVQKEFFNEIDFLNDSQYVPAYRTNQTHCCSMFFKIEQVHVMRVRQLCDKLYNIISKNKVVFDEY